jgi:hypothetical protein
VPGILDNVLGRVRHQTSGAGGILSGIGGGSGVLSTVVGPLQSRLATLQSAGTLQAKIQALSGTLGMRLKTLSAPGGVLSGLGTAAPAPSADLRYQSTQRVYASPVPPAGIRFR